ncbi:MAG: sigma-54-dependent Fis family transcriptional regulator [Zoogloea sp.]|uniref:sigma-54-dependent Fis family transcriptional regulator n=1 Tax=Zoogloea sp. TaxID=49181 RepID=UPI0026284626|nr:sigma-54-dependent Fis family transcriptional regulator [Zoogloea sp.]MDD2991898.1 sigma-54-dependent Fis family transcriptional regulator [Zoogloea sp.]
MVQQKLIEQFNLRSRLRFNVDDGQIWLDENRMLLLHARSMGALRRELFDSLGAERAKGLLIRMGFASGQQDAELAKKLLGAGDPYDVFRIGPELHSFEGLVKATIVKADLDWERGIFAGEVDWYNSWEADSHLQLFGISDDPACWTIVGYASGYVTQFFNRPVIFKETACVACGEAHCHIVGKPLEAWGNDPYLNYFKPDDLQGQLDEMRAEISRLRRSLGTECTSGKLIGASPGFKAAFDLIARAAASPITVLLLGETGVGKEMFARWIHDHGDRSDQPFIAVNCAAIPHDLLESELFGVQKGAYTGAQQSRAGRFERAHGGTLFLDEVGDLPLAAQVKLLRVLQTGEVERLGDDQTRKVDVRLVAATNVDLQEAIRAGRFRADLYYRLATYPVLIPPLRERRSDIPLLAAALVKKYETPYHKQLQGFSDRSMQALMAYPWPGNVRELQNLVERGVLLAPNGGLIEIDHLFAGGAPAHSLGAEVDRAGQVGNAGDATRQQLYEAILQDGFDLDKHEGKLLELAVQRAGGNLTHAAKLLGITRRQLAYRLKQGAEG